MNAAPEPIVATPSLFGTLVESRRERGAPLRIVALQVAIAAHVLVLSAIGIDKWLEVPPIPAPTVHASFSTVAPPPPPPPPAPKPAAAAPAPRVEAPMPQELTQPQETPVDIDTTRVAAPSGSDSGVPGGANGGVAGGVPGGDAPVETIVYELGGPATKPELLHDVEPVYPPMARTARVQGQVILRVIIRPDGTVSDIETLRGQSMGLTEAAIVAVRQRRYKPALLNDVAVPFVMTVIVNFRLSN